MQDNERARARLGVAGTVTELRPAAGQTGAAQPGPGLGQAGASVPRLDSRSLFRGGREVVIEHDGGEYRLRLTASGKLILTK